MLCIEEHIVKDDDCPIRLLDYGLNYFETIQSRAGIKKAVKKEIIQINKTKTEQGKWLVAGDKIEIFQEENKNSKQFKLKLDVIYEDNFLAVIFKPAGFEVSGNKFQTIKNALSFNLKQSNKADVLASPLPAHRLDYATSGLLIIGKTRKAIDHLGLMLTEKQIKKHYIAIVNGKCPEKGEFNSDIDGKKAITQFELIKTIPSLVAEKISMVKINLLTGRRHQIRKHFAEAGFPVVGDKIYTGKTPLLKGKGMFLCASELEFSHPFTNDLISLKAQIPNKFYALMKREEERFKKLSR